jgi:hypothetical protein
MSYQDDRTWADQYLPWVKAICGRQFITEASVDDDQERNTDLIVLKLEAIRIAVRIRRPQWWHERNGQYRGDFTIRWSRPNGTKTEHEKIMEDFGDYLFYAHAYETPPQLRGFGILDLAIYRTFAKAYKRQHGDWPGKVFQVRQTHEEFRAIRWADVPTEAIVLSWPESIAQGTQLVTEEYREAIGGVFTYDQNSPHLNVDTHPSLIDPYPTALIETVAVQDFQEMLFARLDHFDERLESIEHNQHKLTTLLYNVCLGFKQLFKWKHRPIPLFDDSGIEDEKHGG